MEKKTINFKVIMIILAVAGLLLLCAGAIMGGSLYAIPATFQAEPLAEGCIPLKDAKKSDITSVHVNLRSSTVTFKTGRIFDVSGTGNYDSYVKDGTLYAGASDETKYSIKVLGMKFSVPSKWICGYGSYVVTIPTSAKLNDILVDTTDCNITADELAAKNVNIHMTHGKIHVISTKAETFTTKILRGSSSMDTAVISKAATIFCSGATTIGTNVADTSIENLSLETTYGKIDVKGKLSNTNEIKSKYGSANLALQGTESNYAITSSKESNLSLNKASGGTDGEHIGDVHFMCNYGKQNVSFEAK